jgi:hypothetical protein
MFEVDSTDPSRSVRIPCLIIHLTYLLENVLVFDLQLISIIDCNLEIWLIESNHLKMTKVIQIIEL